METINIFCALLCFASLARCSAKESVACSGVPNVECGHFELKCGKDERIHHLTQDYAYKDHTCNLNTKRSKCLSASSNGCCVYDQDDCSETYTLLHVYNLMRECSGKSQCGPLPAPINTLSSCGGNTSTYVRIQYDCIKGSDDTSVNMCDDRTLRKAEMSLFFDQSLNTLTQPISCICETSIIDGDLVEVNYFDVRMLRAHSETGSGSLCSSAVLRGEPDSPDSQTRCNGSLSEEHNLIANMHARYPVGENAMLKLILDNLFVNGGDDSPVMVWVYLKAITGTLETRCYQQSLPPSTLPTQPITYPDSTSAATVTGGQNNTGESTQPVSGDDNTAVIVGVLVPVIIAAIAAVVLFILWKRKHRPIKRRPARQNSYTSSVVNNSEYDEIRDVRDAGHPQVFDPTYELAKETPHGYVNTKQNGAVDRNTEPESVKEKTHTYQNTKANDKPGDTGHSSKPNKEPLKSPFGIFKDKKSQILSFFKRRSNDSLAPPRVVKKPSDASVTSYDHINANIPELKVKATAAQEDERHPYAHTSTIDPHAHTHAKNEVPKPKKSPDVIKRSASPKGVKAVDVGDSYIEFQFGTLDEDGPDFLKPKNIMSEDGEKNAKLMKPSRPPPKPNSPKLNKTNSNLVESNTPIPTPRPSIAINDQQTYDYADVDDDEQQAVSSRPIKTEDQRKSDPRNSAIVYSYADVDNEVDIDNQDMDTLSPELVYEDVDENPDTGLRKCSSAQDISCDSSGEYEVPVKGNNLRPISDSHIVKLNDKSKPKSTVKGIESIVNKVTSPVGLGYVVKELKEVQDLPDLSDPEKLPKELKYANLGLRSPKTTSKAANDYNKVIPQPSNSTSKAGNDYNKVIPQASNTKIDDNKILDGRIPNEMGSKQHNQETKQKEPELNHKAAEVNKVEESAIRKGVLSLAKKFEASNKH